MRFAGLVGACTLGLVLAQGNAHAQWETPEPSKPIYLRWTGTADWEYYSSNGEAEGAGNTFNSFRQKYSLGIDGSIWDPRLDRISVGLDFYRTDRESDGEELDSKNLGFRALGTFFPNRPFPLTLFARRATTDVTGVALASSDRETSAWGIEWNLANRGSQRMRLLFNRTSYEVLSPVTLRERRKTAVLDFNQKLDNSDITFRYDLHGEKEQVNDTDFTRHNFSLTDRTRFDGGSVLLLNAHYTDSNALFTTGQRDELNSSRFSTNFDLPPGDRSRLGFNYLFNDNEGRFVDSSSHTFRTQGRFKWNPHWESLGSLSFGRVDTASTTGDLEQRFGGVRTGLRYNREWPRASLRTSYSVGYDETRFNTEPDRRTVNHFAEVTTQIPIRSDEDILVILSRTVNDNDTTGVGYSYDENRITVGWQGLIGNLWKGRTSATYRDSTRDTFQYGVQKSDEITLDGSLNHPLGGVSLTLSSRNGVSDFFPDPSSSSPFLPGTDLVSKSDVVVAGTHWRLWRSLRLHMQLRFEDRQFTTIGKEQILSYHPRVDYDIHSWRFSAGYSHYERMNGTEFSDDTWLVKVTRRFF
jgi:hypothetical protein